MLGILKATTDLTLKEIAQRCKISKTSVHRLISTRDTAPENNRSLCGRKRKVNPEQEELILGSITELRDKEGSFSSRRLMERTEIRHVTDRTVRRLLNRNGYFFLQARKKGLMSEEDKERGLHLPKRCKKTIPQMYGHTPSPFTWMVFRSSTRRTQWTQPVLLKEEYGEKKSEGLTQGCLAKGKKVGTGGKVAKFIVAISFGKGVVICERYETMNGNFFSSFIDKNFNTMFSYSDKGLSRMWLQDGDPSQNSRAARDAMVRCQSELLKIPPRSPDLNRIENIFHIVSRKLEKDALQQEITHESYEEFCDRVQETINSILWESIDKTIRSMNGRVAEIIRSNGERLKY